MPPESTAPADPDPGFRDAFGSRSIQADASGASVEILRVCPALASTGRCIPDRARRLASVRHPNVASVYSADVSGADGLALEVRSKYVSGTRLSHVLALARSGHLTIGLEAVLHATRHLLRAASSLADDHGHGHGAITPEHAVLTRDGQVVLTDAVFATALERLHWPRERLWQEFRVAVRPQAGRIVLDPAADAGHVAMVALALCAGRPLDLSDYPDRVPAVIEGLRTPRTDRPAAPLPSDVRAWLVRAVPVGTPAHFVCATVAAEALDAAMARSRLGLGGQEHSLRDLAARVDRAIDAVRRVPQAVSPDRRWMAVAPLRPAMPGDGEPDRAFAAATTPAEEIAAYEAPPEPALTLAEALAGLTEAPVSPTGPPTGAESPPPVGPGRLTLAALPFDGAADAAAMGAAASTASAAGPPGGTPAALVTARQTMMTLARAAVSGSSALLRPPAVRWVRSAIAAGIVGAVLWAGIPAVSLEWPGSARARLSPTAEDVPLIRTGSVRVATRPDGARVWCDGIYRGQAPVVLGDLLPGRHVVTVQGDAGTVRAVVRVRAGDTQDVLVPVFGGWIAAFAPVELQVRHRGRTIGTTESGRLLVPPGDYELEFVSEALGIRDSRRVEVRPGEVSAIDISLPPTALEIDVPDGAEVWIDGARAGVAPLLPVPVTVGTRLVVVRFVDGEERQVPVTVGYGKPNRVTVERPASSALVEVPARSS